MVDFNFKFKNNKLETRVDVFSLFQDLTEPLRNFYSEKCAFLQLDNFGVHYGERDAFVEGFSRVVWGLGPFIAGGGKSDFLDMFIKGIENGTDPESDEYWGTLHDVDQKTVELASLAVFILLSPENALGKLSEKGKKTLTEYLYRVNEVVVPRTNWLFFRILVNIALKKSGNRYSAEMLEEDLSYIDSFYLGNGFYSDGKGGQVDYYNPFAIHFYSLIYAKFMMDEDEERCKRFIANSSKFAKNFLHWFDNNGAAIPYGRSISYRFAMSAFFGALAFCNVEALPWDVVKTIVMKNMRWWLDKPIFARDGVLTVGYAYPNLVMSEEYNSPTAPYWAFKWFIILAIDKDHPFWTAKERDVLERDDISVQNEMKFLIQKVENGDNSVALCSGKFIINGFSNFTAKYSKFAYSSKYAFSVSRCDESLRCGAFDSMLALKAEGEEIFHVRRRNELKEINERYMHSEWSPCVDVTINTYLIPCGDYHIRIHKLNAKRNFYAAEGGFSIRRWEYGEFNSVECDENKALVKTDNDTSIVINLSGYRGATTASCENSNLHFQRTIIPTLEANVVPGENILACAVYAGSAGEYSESVIENAPTLEIEGKKAYITFKGEQFLTIDLS